MGMINGRPDCVYNNTPVARPVAVTHQQHQTVCAFIAYNQTEYIRQ